MFSRVSLIVCSVAVLLLAQGGLASIIVDGQLDDWGATPFADWVPDAPAWYIEENWGDHPGEHGAYPYGGETFDQEALYALVDSGDLYVTIVTSFPEGGAFARGNQVMPGDVAIDLDGDDIYEYGIIGHGSNKGDVYYGPAWSLPHGFIGFPQDGPSTLSGGTYVGTVPFVYANAGDLEGNGTDTFVLEMSVPLSLLGDPVGPASLHHVMTCGNDALDGAFIVPEPATLGLLMIGAALTFGSRRRQYH